MAGLSLLSRSSERAIRDCVRNAMRIAGERGYRSIAFPLIGAETGGFNPERAQTIITEELGGIDFDGEVRIVCFRPRGK